MTFAHDSNVPDAVVRGSITDLAACQRAIVKSEPDVVFHLAAQAKVQRAQRDPHATLEANVRGTYNMLEAFRLHTPRSSTIIVASSDKAYGELPGSESYTESTPLEGRGPYDVSKSCTDLIARSYGESYGLKVGIVRAGNIYGPRDTDMSRIVPSVCSRLARGETPILLSDGSPVRDYLFIDDAVRAYMLLAENYWLDAVAGVRVLNFSGGEPFSAKELAMIAIEVAGFDPARMRPIITGTRRGEIQRQVLDSACARRTLAWVPWVSLREGLRLTIEWWRERLHHTLTP